MILWPLHSVGLLPLAQQYLYSTLHWNTGGCLRDLLQYKYVYKVYNFYDHVLRNRNMTEYASAGKITVRLSLLVTWLKKYIISSKKFYFAFHSVVFYEVSWLSGKSLRFLREWYLWNIKLKEKCAQLIQSQWPFQWPIWSHRQRTKRTDVDGVHYNTNNSKRLMSLVSDLPFHSCDAREIVWTNNKYWMPPLCSLPSHLVVLIWWFYITLVQNKKMSHFVRVESSWKIDIAFHSWLIRERYNKFALQSVHCRLTETVTVPYSKIRKSTQYVGQ